MPVTRCTLEDVGVIRSVAGYPYETIHPARIITPVRVLIAVIIIPYPEFQKRLIAPYPPDLIAARGVV